MSITLRRFPEFELALFVFRDLIDGAALREVSTGGRAGRERETRWLTWIDPGADLSQLDLMSITELKRRVDRDQRQGGWDERFRTAIVSTARRNEPMVNLWKGYVGRDPHHLAKPVVFSNLEGACAYLGLPAEAREPLAQAIGLSRASGPAAHSDLLPSGEGDPAHRSPQSGRRSWRGG